MMLFSKKESDVEETASEVVAQANLQSYGGAVGELIQGHSIEDGRLNRQVLIDEE